MSRLLKSLICSAVCAVSFSSAFAQEESTNSETSAEEPMDEIIVQGRKSWEGHDGMEAFWNGDFETAEIEFEQEFKSLRRAESAKYNAGVDAQLGIDRANAVGQASVGGVNPTGPGSAGAPPAAANAPDLGFSGRVAERRATGKNLLNDGIVTDEDFAFTKYMAGLSELKLGKNAEAKKSLKRSVDYDGKNHDARMRLGLLYVMEKNFDKAADQLEAIDKLREKCRSKECTEYDEILSSAATLADHLTHAIKSQ